MKVIEAVAMALRRQGNIVPQRQAAPYVADITKRCLRHPAKTIGLCDQSNDDVSVGKVERIGI
jgi:hypothetical protein